MVLHSRLLVCLAWLCLVLACAHQTPADPPATSPAVKKALPMDQILACQKKLEPLAVKLGKPKPNDWLATHPEPGQTFDEYLKSDPNRPTELHTTLYIQPIGEFTPAQQKLVDDTVSFMAVFYGVPVKTLKPLAADKIPASAQRVHRVWRSHQILTGWILDYLRKNARPVDAVAVLGLTASDLWPGEGWNFVFGEASLTDRVGVWSLYRYGDPDQDYTIALRRTLKVAVHETGHMLGVYHCTVYECGMNGSNHLQEMDERPLAFCPIDEAKLWWACKLAPKPRYEALAAWADKRKLAEEAAFWRKAAEALK